VFTFLGISGLLPGIYLVRQARTLRDFNTAMEYNNRSLRGVVCDSNGSPIPKATVDVFLDGAEKNQPMVTMRTDARGRFSFDLPEGEYVLDVGAPEIGESAVQVAIAKAGHIAELQIKLEVNPSIRQHSGVDH